MKEDPSFLHLAIDLKLPADGVTQTFGFIARKGGGKTYAATKLAEEMIAAGAQVVCMDPVGNWYGLRLGADGKQQGLSIYVFGGERGDIPLHPDAGAKVARLLVEKRISAVLDVSSFRKGDRRRFATDFAEEFFHSKKSQRSPVHLFLEEAQKLVPQVPEQDERRMLGAFEDIVRLGRNYGIGATMISQRPQSINKEVLSQVECLVVGQINGVHERKAIDAWVSEHGLDRGLLGELPSLKIGQMFVWSPQWLKVFKKVEISAKRTLDASATPKLGHTLITAGELSPMDIQSLERDFSDAIERAKADDPRELKNRIAELEKQAASKSITTPALAEIERHREESRRQMREGVERAERVFRKLVDDMEPHVSGLQKGLERFALEFSDALAKINQAVVPKAQTRPAEPQATVAVPTPLSYAPAPANGHVSNGTGEKLAGGERKILTVLAQYPTGRNKVQIALIAGYSHNGGGFNNYLSGLRSRGLIEGSGDSLRATRSGLNALGSYDPLPTGQDLLSYWCGQVGKAERSILTHLATSYPRAISKEELGVATGYESSGGGFNNALSRLRTLELIQGRGEIRMSEELA